MTPTTQQIRERLAEIQRGIAGIKRAYIYAPQIIPESDLPVFCTFAGPATVTLLSEALAEETRTWVMRLFVRPVQAGYDGEAEKSVDSFLVGVRDIFLSHPMLGKGTPDSVLPFVRRAVWFGDGGIQILPYAGQNYLGAEFRLGITTIVPVVVSVFE